jgi:hypothetical protein
MAERMAHQSADETSPARWSGDAKGGEGLVALAAVLVGVFFAVLSLIALPAGFGGADDFHYLRAAERWVKEGPYAGTDHWQTRLPYVLGLAFVLWLPLPPDPVLYSVNMLGFCAMVVSLALMAYRANGAHAAAWTVFLASITPFFLRRATVLYPEIAEAGLAVASLAVAWLAVTGCRATVQRLAFAGALAGLAFIIRQTSLSVPVAFCAWLLLHCRGDIRHLLGTIIPYGAGAMAVLLCEAAFYAIMTGDPFWRLKVDLGHVTVPTSKMEGLVYRDGVPLFNADLASRWRVPGFLSVHWTVDGLSRLLVDPAAAPFIAVSILGVGIALWKGGSTGARDLAWLALITLVAQWILNTFVMTLAPNARYYLNAAAVLALPAGFFLSSLPGFLRVAVAVGLLLHLPAVIAIQPYYASVSSQVRQVRAWALEGQHHLGGSIPERTLLLRIDEPRLRELLPVGEPPVGGTLIIDSLPDPRRAENRCEDGTERWQLIDSFVPRTWASLLMRRFGFERFINEAMITQIEGSGYRAYLLRRTC